MRTTEVLIIIIVQTIFSFNVSAQNQSTVDSLSLIAEFKTNTEKWREAYNSKDAQNLVPLYTEDAQYISSHVSGLVAAGRDKLIANFQNGMNMAGHIDSVEILRMEVSCDQASLLCKYQATNSGETVVGRNLLIMKKINGVWIITLHMTVV